MRKKEQKPEIITFKVDSQLARAIRSIPNRSEFIRNALLSALNRICPLCGGSGILDADEERHWEDFSRHHRLEHCDDCHAQYLVCLGQEGSICEESDR